MNTPLHEALDRTLLLMRDDLVESVADADLLSGLTGTQVALVADAQNLACHSAQCAYVTAALLMARSGHQVHLIAPDVASIDLQPPLKQGGLISALMEVGHDLMPSAGFSLAIPEDRIDLEVRFGNSPSSVRAKRKISVAADLWSARLSNNSFVDPWFKTNWPFGGLAAGGLVSVEAFKMSMQKLRRFAKVTSIFDKQFALSGAVRFELATSSAPQPIDLGAFDIVSAGAIANCVLFVLARIPKVSGKARIIDDDFGDLSNLNRNALMRRSMIQHRKVLALSSLSLGDLQLEAIPFRYNSESAINIGPLSRRVLVGVDHIPTRWVVQRAKPDWLGVGATSHWSSMASFHSAGLACAGCLHPSNTQNDQGAIPTVSFVSFFAGLQLASYFIRATGGESVSCDRQQTYITSLRPETPWYSSVAWRSDCPVEKHAA